MIAGLIVTSMNEPHISHKLSAIRQRLQQAEVLSGREDDPVTLLAVSKQQPAAAIAACHAQGQRCFAESYLQEALPKLDALQALAIEWHFIGRLQANKTAAVARHFSWVQSVDRFRIARRLSQQRPPELTPLNVCVQVNISADPAKAGVGSDDVAELCRQIDGLPALRLRGLMAIPAVAGTSALRRQEFARLRRLYQSLREQGFALDTLSMGMSGDLEEAVLEGATMVRIGSALFGQRGEQAL